MNKIDSYIKYFLFIPLVILAQNNENEFSHDTTNVFTSKLQQEVFNIFE
jgi:hypothetical protein